MIFKEVRGDPDKVATRFYCVSCKGAWYEIPAQTEQLTCIYCGPGRRINLPLDFTKDKEVMDWYENLKSSNIS